MSVGSVFVVDDEPEVRKGLERLLRAAGIQASLFASAQEFLLAVTATDPGCVILDYQMPGLNGLELQDVLAARGAHLQIVFLTGHGDIPKTVQAMRGGAVDFLVKPAAQEQILAAVQRALARDAAARAQQTEIEDVRARIADLSPRERQVMGHVIAGRLNKQIADILGTAEKTVKIQRAGMMQKMGVRSVAELVRRTEKAGVVPSERGVKGGRS
jgi:FixJ family two-component response regulator